MLTFSSKVVDLVDWWIHILWICILDKRVGHLYNNARVGSWNLRFSGV